jgi:hypothetical protein
MKRTLLIAVAVGWFAPQAWAKYDPIMSQPEIVDGWTPAQAADFQGAQIEYSQAKKRHGATSPEATRARQRMMELSRLLRADEREEISAPFNPGTHGTYAPPEAFERQIDPIQ